MVSRVVWKELATFDMIPAPGRHWCGHQDGRVDILGRLELRKSSWVRRDGEGPFGVIEGWGMHYYYV
jgi:hypothetical protein